MTPTKTRSPLRALMTVAATAAMAAGGVIIASAPAQAAGNNCPPPGANPPTANTWYDADGNYRGTRSETIEQYRAIQRTVVYETFGHDYFQRETWDLRIGSKPMRLQCERQQNNPDPKPGTPIPVGGGGGGASVGFFRPIGGFGGSSPSGTVTVGNPETVKEGKVTVGPVTNAQ